MVNTHTHTHFPDYGSALCSAVKGQLLERLQLVQNAASRFLMKSKVSTHINPIIASMHRLLMKFKIDFKIILIIFNGLQDHNVFALVAPRLWNSPPHNIADSVLNHVPQCILSAWP